MLPHGRQVLPGHGPQGVRAEAVELGVAEPEDAEVHLQGQHLDQVAAHGPGVLRMRRHPRRHDPAVEHPREHPAGGAGEVQAVEQLRAACAEHGPDLVGHHPTPVHGRGPGTPAEQGLQAELAAVGGPDVVRKDLDDEPLLLEDLGHQPADLAEPVPAERGGVDDLTLRGHGRPPSSRSRSSSATRSIIAEKSGSSPSSSSLTVRSTPSRHHSTSGVSAPGSSSNAALA